MARRHRFRAVVVAWVLGSGLAAVGTAWACVPQPLVTISPRASGPVGSRVTVNVVGISNNATNEIRWIGIDGPQLGTGNGAVFSTTVTIPSAPDGLYAVVVLERMADGSVGSTGRAAFLVTAAGGAGPASARSDPIVPATHRSSSGASLAFATGAVGLLAGAAGGVLLTRRRRRGGSASPEPGSASGST